MGIKLDIQLTDECSNDRQVSGRGGQDDGDILWSFGLIHSIDHAKLLAKLSSLEVSGSALEWFKSHMHDRQQYVRIGCEMSGMRKPTPQVNYGIGLNLP